MLSEALLRRNEHANGVFQRAVATALRLGAAGNGQSGDRPLHRIRVFPRHRELPMSLHNVTPGAKAPEEFNVIIEIPMNADPIKYEVDKASGALFVDRFMTTAMHYPCNYGYVPQTLSDDGDPVDVLVITPFPLTPGVVVTCRPIGVLKMTDEAGGDAKVLAVPTTKILPIYDHWKKPEDINQMRLKAIQHFFEHYKDLEAGKWVKVQGWEGPEEAKAEISSGMASYAKGQA
jgi:inorganic pyrophosphatase